MTKDKELTRTVIYIIHYDWYVNNQIVSSAEDDVLGLSCHERLPDVS